MVEGSSFEAIRSQEIPELLHEFFPESLMEVKMHSFTSTFLWGVNLANPNDSSIEKKIQFAIELDRVICKWDLLVPDTLFGIYPKPKFPIRSRKVIPYRCSEIKKLFAENFFSKRKIRSILLSSVFTSWIYNLLRIGKKCVKKFQGFT